MKMAAKTKFASNSIQVPVDWSQPSGDPAGKQYTDAFQPSERAVPPHVAVPPLFMPKSPNKYHVDTQKMLNEKFGAFIDKTCEAICSAWSTWQSAATMVGVMITGPTASMGQIVGPPLTPLIMAQGAVSTPMEMKYTSAIANVIGTAWLSFTATVKVPGLPWYPMFAACPSPVAPPTPNVPVPFAALTQVPASIAPATMKQQMVGMLGDPKAQYHQELFDCICDAFDKMYTLWKVSTMVTNVLGTGPVPTFAPPYVPVGPVVGGVGTMTPGGFA